MPREDGGPDPLGAPVPAPSNDTAPPAGLAHGTAPPILGTAPTVSSTPSPGQGVALTASGTLPPSAAATGIRMLTADPAAPLTGEFWYRTDLDKLSVKTASGVKRTVALT